MYLDELKILILIRRKLLKYKVDVLEYCFSDNAALNEGNHLTKEDFRA